MYCPKLFGESTLKKKQFGVKIIPVKSSLRNISMPFEIFEETHFLKHFSKGYLKALVFFTLVSTSAHVCGHLLQPGYRVERNELLSLLLIPTKAVALLIRKECYNNERE